MTAWGRALLAVAVLALVGLALWVGWQGGVHSVPEPTPAPTVTHVIPTPVPTDVCRDAAVELDAHSYRMIDEVVTPLMFNGANPDDLRDTLLTILDEYQSTYFDAQRRCDGLGPVVFD